MQIVLTVLGKTKAQWLLDGEHEYIKRLAKYANFQMEVLPEIKKTAKLSENELLVREATSLRKNLKFGDVLVLLDDKGKKHNSLQMASSLQNLLNSPGKRVVFLVGGAYGFHPEIKKLAHQSWSLSPLTFSHQMVRVIFLEQLYRCFTILNNEPYHHE